MARNEADMVDGNNRFSLQLRQIEALKSNFQDYKNEVKKCRYILLSFNIVVLAVVIPYILIASSNQQIVNEKLSTHLDNLSILHQIITTDKIAIKDIHEFLLLHVVSGKDVPTTSIEYCDIISRKMLKLNFSLAFKRELARLRFRFKIQKQNPRIVTGFKRPRRVAVTSSGHIVVTETDGHSITVIKGNERKQLLNLKGTNNGLFKYPSGIAITSDGYMLVTDYHRLQKVSFDGEIKDDTFGSDMPGTDKKAFNQPGGIAIHPHTGLVYVADRINHRIMVLNSDLSYNDSFGEKGSSIRQFDWPTDVTFDNDGYLYVSDFNNNRILKFTSQGDFVLEFSSKGQSSEYLKKPSGIAIDTYVLVYVKDSGNNNISIFDTSGNFWDTVSNGYGSGGIAINNGTVYICDSDGGNLRIF